MEKLLNLAASCVNRLDRRSSVVFLESPSVAPPPAVLRTTELERTRASKTEKLANREGKARSLLLWPFAKEFFYIIFSF
ncbi:hypothetical protein GWI33_004094 [Rhynchophorus ferrugineus]|uniref:Uncharacterized protein n=1 Tax=Rhynchophorus ferrugineus TaxID=354439 RepID=A0A834MKN1_RHYFE|nr:hypothetical protein GWI33_004094 [Rhynchophorus ferrugineus]